MEDSGLDLDSVPLSITSSDSLADSTTSSSSSPTINSPVPSSRKLTVSNLSYKLSPQRALCSSITAFPKSQPPSIEVLKSISFTAYSSEILAVVGPSGAGKSTLIRTISGRVNGSIFNTSSVLINDRFVRSPRQLRRLCGYVAQEDNLLPLLTVRETLMFSAKFRLKNTKLKEIQKGVEDLIRELGLLQVADSYVGGDEETRGISGGERKRVAIGVDVIHNPLVLLLDEPTSGLGSSSALQIMQLLSAMARNRGQIVILTIHQPSYRIINYISSILLLSRGRVAHYGNLLTLEETISSMGLTLPTQVNALEFAMEVIQQLQDHSSNPKEPLVIPKEIFSSAVSSSENDHQDYCSRLDEICTLSWRFWRMIYRTKQLFLARTLQALIAGIGLGSVYFKVKANPEGIGERLGLFAFSLSFLLSSTVEALPIFLHERRVLMKETSRRMYRISSYMIANTLVFLPFLFAVAVIFAVPVYWIVGLSPNLGAFAFFTFIVWMITLMASSLVLFLSAIATDYVLGNSLICMFLGVFFLFSGYFIPKDSIPKYWLFMYYISLYRYPLDAMIVNEYWGLKDKCFSWQKIGEGEDEQVFCSINGGEVLRERGLLNRDIRWINVGIMCVFFVAYRVLCWAVLVRKASKTKL